MADLIQTATGMFGGFDLGSIWTMLSYGLLILVVAGVVIFFLYKHLMNKKFNKTITFWKRNPYTGYLVADRNIKAMTIRLDTFGNLAYRLKTPYETKNLLPKLKIEAKPNVHYVEYCEDGRVVEFAGILDFDDKRKSMDAKFTDQNTELGRSSMQQMNKERYEKTSFWKEHASLLVNIGAIVVIMVFLWLIADKLITLVGSIGGLLDKAGILQESQSNILDSLNNLLTQHNIA
jgi:roadblock/LC7 domain-containing protein